MDVESVLCVPAADFRVRAGFVGYRGEGFGDLAPLLKEGVYRDRTPDLEQDEAWKQVVAYGLVFRGAELLHYTRSAVADPRLAGGGSIGVGGHATAADEAAAAAAGYVGSGLRKSAVVQAMRREAVEELLWSGPAPAIRLLGRVNDEGDRVGRCHVGIVFAIRFPASAEVRMRRREADSCRWLVRGALSAWPGPLEGWSAILKEALLTRRVSLA
jgi:predicted NUDIX family phosphoesterase